MEITKILCLIKHSSLACPNSQDHMKIGLNQKISNSSMLPYQDQQSAGLNDISCFLVFLLPSLQESLQHC